jgi:hypothetical protein
MGRRARADVGDAATAKMRSAGTEMRTASAAAEVSAATTAAKVRAAAATTNVRTATTAAAHSSRGRRCRQAERKPDCRRTRQKFFPHDIFAHGQEVLVGTNAKSQRQIARAVPAASNL